MLILIGGVGGWGNPRGPQPPEVRPRLWRVVRACVVASSLEGERISKFADGVALVHQHVLVSKGLGCVHQGRKGFIKEAYGVVQVCVGRCLRHFRDPGPQGGAGSSGVGGCSAPSRLAEGFHPPAPVARCPCSSPSVVFVGCSVQAWLNLAAFAPVRTLGLTTARPMNSAVSVQNITGMTSWLWKVSPSTPRTLRPC